MNFIHGITTVVLAAALVGTAGCAARSGPAGEVPETPATSAPAATPSPEAGSTEGSQAEQGEAVITVGDFSYDLPPSVAPGSTVTVINEGEATHTVTAQGEGSFEAIAAGGETVTFTAPEEPGEYPITCTYHPEMSGTLTVE